MPSDLELLGRLLLAASIGVAVGAGSYLLAVGGTVLVLVVKLPPRYRPERLVDALARLDGVDEVEWET